MTTYAVIQTGGKQYRVSEGESVEVEKLPVGAGQEVRFDQVLMIAGASAPKIGRPFLEGAQVVGEVVDQFKGEKIVIFRYKKRKGYDKKIGHRQLLTRVKVTAIKG